MLTFKYTNLTSPDIEDREISRCERGGDFQQLRTNTLRLRSTCCQLERDLVDEHVEVAV